MLRECTRLGMPCCDLSKLTLQPTLQPNVIYKMGIMLGSLQVHAVCYSRFCTLRLSAIKHNLQSSTGYTKATECLW